MTSAKFIEYRNAIDREYSAAVTKHPKFCDLLIDESKIAWAETEFRIKAKNSKQPYYADCILMEEVAEAFSAISVGENEHAKQELAQVCAVCIRIMDEIDKEGKTNEKN